MQAFKSLKFLIFIYFLETFQLFPGIASGPALGINSYKSVSVFIVVIWVTSTSRDNITMFQLVFGKPKQSKKQTHKTLGLIKGEEYG